MAAFILRNERDTVWRLPTLQAVCSCDVSHVVLCWHKGVAQVENWELVWLDCSLPDRKTVGCPTCPKTRPQGFSSGRTTKATNNAENEKHNASWLGPYNIEMGCPSEMAQRLLLPCSPNQVVRHFFKLSVYLFLGKQLKFCYETIKELSSNAKMNTYSRVLLRDMHMSRDV